MNIEEIKKNMIAWAQNKLNSKEYIGWCLSFIEDALEISNDIEIFGGNSAKESAEMYNDGLHTNAPKKGSFVFYDCFCKDDDDNLVNWGHCGIALDNGDVIHSWDKVRIDNYLEIENLISIADTHPKYLGWVDISRVLEQKK